MSRRIAYLRWLTQHYGTFVWSMLVTLVTQPNTFTQSISDARAPIEPPLASRRPWWPRGVAEVVQTNLFRGAKVFEYGGGGSTLWLEDLGASVTSVEHDAAWHRVLTGASKTSQILLIEPTDDGTVQGFGTRQFFDEYVNTIAAQSDQFDLVIVDGRARVACVEKAMAYVKPGGRLLLDDSQRLRYTHARKLLADWHGTSIRGAKPGWQVVVTRIWQRPA